MFGHNHLMNKFPPISTPPDTLRQTRVGARNILMSFTTPHFLTLLFQTAHHHPQADRLI